MSDLTKIRIGKNLKHLREKSGQSKSSLSRELGLPDTSVGKYESGVNTPKTETLEKYCEIFNVYIGDIVGQDMWLGESRPPDDVGQLKELERINLEKKLMHQELDRRDQELDKRGKHLDKITQELKRLRAEIGELDPESPLFGRIMELLKAAESE